MKLTKYLTLLVVLAFYSCGKSELGMPFEKPVPEGMTRLQIQTNFIGFAKPTTRNEGIEDNNIQVFLLNKNSDNILSQSAKINPATGIVDVTLAFADTDTDTFRVVIIANPPIQFTNSSGINENFADIGYSSWTNYTELKTELNTLAIGASGVSEVNIPMTGVSDEYTKGQLEALTTPIQINLTRMVAKIGVTVDPAIPQSQFKIEEISVCNAPQRGWFLSPTEYPEKMRDNSANLVNYTPVSPTTPIYIYESRKEERTAVIVKAIYNGSTESYYRLGMDKDYDYSYKNIDNEEKSFTVKQGQDYFLRNCQYTYNITAVSGKGYSSYEDAVAGGASNMMGVIKASIEVIDLSSHDIIDNGEYFLGLSNSQFDFWFTGDTTLDVSTISYTGNLNGISGNATIIPDSIVGSHPTILSGFPPSGSDLKMNFPAGFKSCQVRVMYGNLVKIIKIRRHNTLPPTSLVCSQFSTDDFVYGIVEMGSEWLGLSDNNNEGIPGMKEVVINDTQHGGIYVKPLNNFATSGAKTRTATVYLSRRNEQGRVRLYFSQIPFNMDDNSDNLDFTPFVGAFWRASQTGERLIRISPNSGKNIAGYWCAASAYYDTSWDPDNGDGIVIDTKETEDKGVSWSSIKTPADMNIEANDEKYSINTNTKFVETFDSKGNEIYFRVGLQKKYIPTLDKPARYAMIILTYTSNSDGKSVVRTQRLFVRQGDEADYLMRPVDRYGKVTPNWANSPKWRPNAVKFLPYNLTDPNGFPSLNYAKMTTMPLKGIDDNKKLTKYPTQAGAIFLYNPEYTSSTITYTRKAIPPIFTNVVASGSTYAPLWNALLHETCPDGYHRPVDATPEAVAANYHPDKIDYFATKTPENSEMRQSLWLNPGKGNSLGAANNDNRIEGYYADGYFDRRMIVNSITGNTLSAVERNSNDVAYKGTLFFNPNNFASLFFPFTGRRSLAGGVLQNAGATGTYWSSTITNGNGSSLDDQEGTMSIGSYGNEAYSLSIGNLSPPLEFNSGYKDATMFSWNTYRGGSVRCVKDEP